MITARAFEAFRARQLNQFLRWPRCAWTRNWGKISDLQTSRRQADLPLSGAGICQNLYNKIYFWLIFLTIMPSTLKGRLGRDAAICPHCQQSNTVRAKFCIHCGLPLGEGGEFFQICDNCQIRVPHNANFCFKCGHKLPQIESGEEDL